MEPELAAFIPQLSTTDHMAAGAPTLRAASGQADRSTPKYKEHEQRGQRPVALVASITRGLPS